MARNSFAQGSQQGQGDTALRGLAELELGHLLAQRWYRENLRGRNAECARGTPHEHGLGAVVNIEEYNQRTGGLALGQQGGEGTRLIAARVCAMHVEDKLCDVRASPHDVLANLTVRLRSAARGGDEAPRVCQSDQRPALAKARQRHRH